MSEFAEKIADAVEVALGDDGHCIVYKRLAVVAAIEAARQSAGQERGEAVAWHTEDHLTDKSATTYSKEVMERWLAKGWPITPLYAAPTDAQSRIAELEAQLASLDASYRGAETLLDATKAQLTESREREGRMREALIPHIADLRRCASKIRMSPLALEFESTAKEFDKAASELLAALAAEKEQG